MYANGMGVPQDYEEAVRLYRLAADQGDAEAQSNLGWMYEKDQVFLRMIRLWLFYKLAADQEIIRRE